MAEEIREWMGDFDPELFELDLVNKDLDEIFRPARAKRNGQPDARNECW
jgi:hypothetical protein